MQDYKDAVRIAQYLNKGSIRSVFNRKELFDAAEDLNIKNGVVYKYITIPKNRTGRGLYSVAGILDNPDEPPVQPVNPKSVFKAPAPQEKINLQMHNDVDTIAHIPEVDTSYVKWGSFSDVKGIISSKRFFPIYIFGPSGNGKTMMVEQACAHAKREYIRVNLSPETCEDDLIGGWRLKDGNTIFEKGPVIKAMEAGAVLLLDEADRAHGNKILCLQSVLEGKPILLKKTGETVSPAVGFTVVVTANSAGRGSEDGRYSGVAIIDDAFLERFPIAIDQQWPSKSIERRIVAKAMEKYDCVDEEFADKLVTWSKIIRKTYDTGGIDDVISTRRLDHIVQTYAIFQNRLKAIELTVSRYPGETRESFTDLYTKIDEGALVDEDDQPQQEQQTGQNGDLDSVPF